MNLFKLLNTNALMGRDSPGQDRSEFGAGTAASFDFRQIIYLWGPAIQMVSKILKMDHKASFCCINQDLANILPTLVFH